MYPIIFLWAHPRSMSTAIERMMRERGDLHCLHEPFLRYYYLQRSEKNLTLFDAAGDHPTSYEATREMILEQAEKQPVFAKDMSYYIIPELLKDIDFFSRIKHCFLIRNPVRSLLSYYKLDPYVSLKEIGLESQWLHFQKAEQWQLKPIVIEAETVQAHPKPMMERFWSELGLDYKAHAFDWNTDAPPTDWKYVEGWHQQVSQSAGIQTESAAQKQRAKDEFAQATQKAPHLKDYLEYHLPAYHALQEYALKL
ncbi:MAG: hypothetical protein ACPGSM_16630 [Thiolinea sp.]